MFQPKDLLTKRGTLLGQDSRVARKDFATIGFSDFATGIFIVFPIITPATVSDFETVFLCPLRSLLLPDNPFIQQTSPAL